MMIWQLMAVQAVTFGLLIVFLWQLFYRQADRTRQRLEQLYQDNLKREQDLAHLKAQTEQELKAKADQADDAIRRLKAETEFECQRVREEAAQQAKEHAERTVAEATAKGQRIQARLTAEAEEQAVALASRIVQALFASRAAEGVHHHLIEALTEEIVTPGSDAARRFPTDCKAVEVAAPFPLTPTQRNSLTAALSSRVGRLVNLKESVAPDLVAGLVLTLNHTVFDGSLSHKLQEMLAHVRASLAR